MSEQISNNNENYTPLNDLSPDKSSNRLIAIIVIAILVIGVLGYIFYYKGQQQESLITDPGETEKEEIQITRQENVYGISGKILEIHDNAIVIETVAMPYGSFNPSLNDKWLWTVSVNENTEIIKLIPNENVSETTNEEDYFMKQSIAINDLKPEDLITITSNDDISAEFSLDEKNIIANKIESY